MNPHASTSNVLQLRDCETLSDDVSEHMRVQFNEVMAILVTWHVQHQR